MLGGRRSHNPLEPKLSGQERLPLQHLHVLLLSLASLTVPVRSTAGAVFIPYTTQVVLSVVIVSSSPCAVAVVASKTPAHRGGGVPYE